MKTISVPNQPCSSALMMPIFGLASRIHDTVNRIPGMISGMIESAKNKALHGVLVRSLIQAKKVPISERNRRGAKRKLQRIEKQPVGLKAGIGVEIILQRELRGRARGLRR